MLLGKAIRQLAALVAVEPANVLPEYGLEERLAHHQNLTLGWNHPAHNLDIPDNLHRNSDYFQISTKNSNNCLYINM